MSRSTQRMERYPVKCIVQDFCDRVQRNGAKKFAITGHRTHGLGRVAYIHRVGRLQAPVSESNMGLEVVETTKTS
jgi:hypothetical protein